MKPTIDTSASTSTSSGASSNSTPNPSSHGFRTQLGHLIPRHALFQVHLHIEQLSNVPLISGEFGIRWKFKNVQSGSGLLSKMKGNRSWSGQGKDKGTVAGETPMVGTEEGELYEDEGDSMHDTTEDDGFTAESPRSPRSPLPRDDHRPFDSLHPPGAQTHINSQSSSSLQLRSEARGMTPWMPLQNYNVKWEHLVNVVVQMDVHRETGDLLPNELRLVVMQVSTCPLSLVGPVDCRP